MNRNTTTRMFRTALLLLFLINGAAAWCAKMKYPGGHYFIFRYILRDKAATTYSLAHPQRFLSRRSIERRQRQGLRADSTDLPVCRRYVRQFEERGTQVVGTSRWHNSVIVRSADSLLLARLGRLPIVAESRCVFVSPDSVEMKPGVRPLVHKHFNKWDSVKNDPLGMARPQIEMLGGDSLHDDGMRGEGMMIAILDGGFQNYDRIPALRKAHIAGTHDFLPATAKGWQPDFHLIDHGTKVLSTLAAQAPEVVMGTAPQATYWLMRCEDPLTEQPVEEDYWTMAAEMADSAGVDVINSSLGYHKYDNDLCTYRLQNLDGQTAFVSQSAAMLAGKGIVLCNSAGNSGMSQWKKIGMPADAPDILTVGAINKDRSIASFCSIGPTQDGRVKPDVVALGAPTALISGRGTLMHDMGTSFSTPVVSGLVACLWQAHRDMTAHQIIDLVRHCSDQYANPTNIYGYGIPNFWKAHKARQPQPSQQPQ